MAKINTRLNRRLGITARQFNAKITRLEKLNDKLPREQKIKLPSRMNLRSIRKEMTANEIRREISRANIFLRKGAENTIKTRGGVKVPRYEYFTLKQELRWNIKYHQNRLNGLNKIKVKRGGRVISSPGGNPERFTAMQYIYEESETLKDISDYNIREYQNIKKRYSGRIDEIERKESQFADNFVNKMLDSYSDIVYGQKGDFIDGEFKGKIEYIKSKLQKLTISEIEDLFDTEEYVHELAYHYNNYLYNQETGRTQMELNPIIDNLRNNIDRIVQEYIDNR